MVGLERLKFLIIDDNYHMLNIISTVLRGFAAKDFIETTDPTEALKVLQSHRIDIVIVDYNMSVLDGVDFVRLARNSPESLNPYIPIIMLTAHTERRRVMSARDAGVTEFCAKPVTAAELARKINAVISSPRPFIKTASYFGPCRRRKKEAFKGPDRRVGGPKDAAPSGPRNEASEAAAWEDAVKGPASGGSGPAQSEEDEMAAWGAMGA
ncbi:MAG: response regulator [Caulobacteraceae bacterium]